jgi:hypothetical protein
MKSLTKWNNPPALAGKGETNMALQGLGISFTRGRYFLDGVEIAWQKLIETAHAKYGYGEGLGLVCTSEATQCLRENGHVVECKEE